MKLAPDSVLAERYRLGQRLGRGGMGEVWSAVHLVTGRRVAIKRLLITADQDHTGDARARFVREAQTACAVEHPNVVQVLDFVEAGDEPPLLVMELLSGETLADRLARDTSLEVEEAARLLLPVVSGVGTAHARGIVHRDLKPANIFLHARAGAEPLVKVLDFGIAKWVASTVTSSDPHTKSGSTLGTPSYMAPEQAIGQRVITHRADVWSFGVICYECLSGLRPVEGDNAAQVVMNLLNTGIMPIERLVPGIPNELARLIGRMLAREPAARSQDLREAFAVLSKCTQTSAPTFSAPNAELERETESVLSPRPTPLVAWAPQTPASVSGSADTALASLPSSAVRRQRKKTLGAGALAILAGFLVALASFSFRKSEAPGVASPSSLAPPRLTGEERVAEPLPVAPMALPSVSIATVSREVARAASVQPAPAKTSRPPPLRVDHLASRVATSPAVPTTLPTPTLPARPAASEQPNGSRCERSRECASKLCVAFRCQ